jgi:2-dehydro-3-deoxyphosphooctonate aldolase (KDO 8-P synthase)
MNKSKKNIINWISEVNNDNNVFFILGPCVIESEAHTLKVAEFIKRLSDKLKFNFIFKSSFDKANRTSVSSYRGPGFKAGLKILAKVKELFNIPVITDVHECFQVPLVAQVADVIQVPAFLCRQTDLLIAAGESKKPVHVKKGQFVSPENMEHVIKKIESTGNKNIWICERGFSFGYNNLVVDYRNFPIMKKFNKPIIFDVTHSVQRPSGLGGTTGGDRCYVPALASAAIVQKIAGIFIEVHDNPEHALSDGPNSVRLSQLEELLKYIINLDKWVKDNKIPTCN